jgi:hypothetical protein
MRSLATIAVVVVLALTSSAQESGSASIGGVYHAVGYNPNGSSYESTVEIVQYESNFLVLWMQKDGSEVLGVGILTDKVFSVSYFSGRPAVSSYRVEGEKLIGQWTIFGAPEVFSEDLTKTNKEPARLPELLRPQPQQQPQENPQKKKPAPGNIVV